MAKKFTTYSTPSNARRAAKAAGLKPEEYRLNLNAANAWTIERVVPVAPTPVEPEPVIEATLVEQEQPVGEPAPKAKKERKPKEQKPEADPATIELAKDIFCVVKPQVRHLLALSNAQAGQMPEQPRFDQPSYQRAKTKYFDRMAAAIESGDVVTLEAITAAVSPAWTIQKVIRTYGRLAAIAMKAVA